MPSNKEYKGKGNKGRNYDELSGVGTSSAGKTGTTGNLNDGGRDGGVGSPDLGGCTVYASGHPCPMCMAAMRLAGVREVVFAYSNDDGAPFGLSTAAIYEDLAKPFAEQSMNIRHVPQARSDLYAEWARLRDQQA